MTKRTFLVTGATKGIGRALSTQLADAGHHVVGVARGRDPDFPGTLVSIDLNDSKASGEAFAELARRHSFDGVINNAGLARMHEVGEIDLADVDDIMRVNLHPTIQTVQAILPTLREKGWGRIVNISSLTVVGIRRLCGLQGSNQQPHPYLGARAGPDRHHRQCRGAWPSGNRVVS
jgi:NAD(P)-dependent dehydrogenase (short-subunit alcohol dehydrogenase family)